MTGQWRLHIAIVGAGPAGLVLARIIARESTSSNSVPFAITLFDRDTSPLDPLYPPQGGQLDLHADSGQLGVREAGLWDEFVKFARYDAQGWRVDDEHGELVAEVTEDAGKNRDKPEISRAQLRQILADNIESIPGVTVKWGQKVQAVEKTQTGYRLMVENSEEQPERFDVVIGADGIWTRVRPILNAAQPVYSGLTMVELSIDPMRVSGQISSRVQKGSYMAIAPRKSLMAQRNFDGSIRVYIALTVPEEWARGSELDFSDIAATKQEILKQYFDNWSADIKDLVHESGLTQMRLWPLYGTPKLSEGGRWDTDEALTLVGDAAHIMPPWTGRGVNMALLDAVELGKKIRSVLRKDRTVALLDKQAVLDLLVQALRAYEGEMWTRMEQEKEANNQAQNLLFAEDSPRGFKEMMKAGTNV